MTIVDIKDMSGLCGSHQESACYMHV